jgi:hypothetical protein
MSIRTINYPWSPFVRIHSPQSVHPVTERLRTAELKGLKVKRTGEQSKGREQTPLSIRVAMQGRHVRVFCRLWIVNRTDMTLQVQFHIIMFTCNC